MCGIVGYIGQQEAAPIIIDGLRRLEYRGYDSAGIATLERRRDRDPPRRGQAGQPGEGPAGAPGAGTLRHRPHPLGHPRPPLRDQRPSPSAPAASWWCTTASSRTISPSRNSSAGRGPHLPLGDRYRNHRPPDRRAFQGNAAISRTPSAGPWPRCGGPTPWRSSASRSRTS